MALPRKGSRKIVVDGLVYRWYIRPKPSYGQAEGNDLTIAIERDDTDTKTRLVVKVPALRPDAWGGGKSVVVLPADVAGYIREALANGWLADQQGSPWEFETKTLPQNTLLN